MRTILHIAIVALLTLGTSLKAGNGNESKPVTGKVMVSGKVSDLKNNEDLAGVRIACKNCEKTFFTDLKGNFFVYLEVENPDTAELEFSQIGYETITVKLKEVKNTAGPLNIVLQSE